MTTSPGWGLVEHHGVHVVPLDDAVGHDLSDDCVCVPLADPVTRDDGSMGWVTVHHSLDGREAHE